MFCYFILQQLTLSFICLISLYWWQSFEIGSSYSQTIAQTVHNSRDSQTADFLKIDLLIRKVHLNCCQLVKLLTYLLFFQQEYSMRLKKIVFLQINYFIWHIKQCLQLYYYSFTAYSLFFNIFIVLCTSHFCLRPLSTSTIGGLIIVTSLYYSPLCLLTVTFQHP